MNEDTGLRFEYGFDSDAANSYLVLKLSGDVKLLNHQAEIICQNPNPAFVPFHIRHENENTGIYYNITSKISLSQYLQRKRLNKKELLDLLNGITKKLMMYSNYLLDLSSYVIDADFIYVNPATAEVSLIYVPAYHERDTIEVYRAFLKNMVVNSANVDDNAGDNYLQRILNYLKSDLFSLIEFSKLLVELRNSGVLHESPATQINRYGENTEDKRTEVRGDIHSDRGIKENACTGTSERKNIWSIIIVQVLLILAVSIACLLMISQESADLASMAGVAIIAGALDMLIIKRISGRNRNVVIEDSRNKKAEAIISRNSHNPVQKHTSINFEGGSRKPHIAVDMLKACDTVMISEVPLMNYPYLESLGAQKGERIMINKDRFIIGRLGSMVDYVIQESTVGKLHAQITGDGGSYFLKDLNSKNGTYINDTRIISNKECEIKNNDKIRFSSFEYIFRQ